MNTFFPLNILSSFRLALRHELPALDIHIPKAAILYFCFLSINIYFLNNAFTNLPEAAFNSLSVKQELLELLVIWVAGLNLVSFLNLYKNGFQRINPGWVIFNILTAILVSGIA